MLGIGLSPYEDEVDDDLTWPHGRTNQQYEATDQLANGEPFIHGLPRRFEGGALIKPSCRCSAKSIRRQRRDDLATARLLQDAAVADPLDGAIERQAANFVLLDFRPHGPFNHRCLFNRAIARS